jgi:hypothetical protein
MQKPPRSLILTTVCGGLLGAGLALTGLGLRLWPSLPSPFGVWGLWTGSGVRWAVAASDLAWPMIAAGCAWLAVVLGLWMRLVWIRRVGLVVGVVTLLALGLALPLGLAALVGLLSASMSRWLSSGEAVRVA